MPQVQLRLPAVLGAELDVLLAPFILHAQLIIRGRADDVAGVVCLCHVVRMPGVVQRMGDIGPVRVPFMERHRHFCALYQREVNPVGIAAVGSGQAQQHALVTLLFAVLVCIKLHPVQSLRRLMRVDIPAFRAADPRRQRAADLRSRLQRRTPALRLTVRHRRQRHPQRILPAAAEPGPDDHHRLLQHVRQRRRYAIVRYRQHLPRT